ncbi:hypothetical protein [Ligilactobacillus acidipiscis]|uniref:hypothetical protein n=1 Tax=Ligilactobacillus acidipiscis TaxID=89059 RepID=UPI0023F92A68|nr:hypothetical protein [Ligilactobacillus acidipiscis]WEV57340.1 hypothetical protein OZX66_01990 [Ligilactobacillus acidipiscis]
MVDMDNEKEFIFGVIYLAKFIDYYHKIPATFAIVSMFEFVLSLALMIYLPREIPIQMTLNALSLYGQSKLLVFVFPVLTLLLSWLGNDEKIGKIQSPIKAMTFGWGLSLIQLILTIEAAVFYFAVFNVI